MKAHVRPGGSTKAAAADMRNQLMASKSCLIIRRPFGSGSAVAVDAAGAVGAPEICGCRAPRNLRLRSPHKSAVAEPVIIRGGGAPSI